jgi:ADP-dependent NAD(P)H-hydrate dehydratase / NAD(P)H-hydrate epimerase
MTIARIGPLSLAPLATVADLRALEVHAGALSPEPLMTLAGRAVAQLAQALAPHAQRIWVACGPGNNGGDGLEAALHLHQAGFEVCASLTVPLQALPPDAQAAGARALAAGVNIQHRVPLDWLQGLRAYDLCIDALLGIGNSRALQGMLLACVQAINQSPALTLAVDLPSGLQADTGHADMESTVHADHTLSLLRLKPGLLTGAGRDLCGQLWLDSLGTDMLPLHSSLRMGCPPAPAARPHASHKGSHGDVAIVGGDQGMLGASILAAHAALHAGAGRIYWCPLSSPAGGPSTLPDCMQREVRSLALQDLCVVAGCGGGTAIAQTLPDLLTRSARLVLDADALNAIAGDAALQGLLFKRSAQRPTVITPHPQEAARLLQTSPAEVQRDRLGAALSLSRRWPGCTVVLKGSGTVVCQGAERLHINNTGNARLAVAGTGDVLAGLLGARLQSGVDPFEACCRGVWEHGRLAQTWPSNRALTASALAQALSPPVPAS